MGDEGEGVGEFVEAAVFAEFVVGGEAEGGGGEGDVAEGGPEVFPQSRGDGFLADEGELVEGVFVLSRIVRYMFLVDGGLGR